MSQQYAIGSVVGKNGKSETLSTGIEAGTTNSYDFLDATDARWVTIDLSKIPATKSSSLYSSYWNTRSLEYKGNDAINERLLIGDNMRHVHIDTAGGDDCVLLDPLLSPRLEGTIRLGAGNDRVFMEAPDDARLGSSGTLTLDGGEGTDKLMLTSFSFPNLFESAANFNITKNTNGSFTLMSDKYPARKIVLKNIEILNYNRTDFDMAEIGALNPQHMPLSQVFDRLKPYSIDKM